MDWFELVCYLGAFMVLLLVVFVIPLVGSVFIAMFLANTFGFSGLAWWCVVITIYLIITSILYYGRGE